MMFTLVSSLELIRGLPMCSMLTASQAESVAQAVVKFRFKRGREATLATMQTGDYIGEMSLIDDEPHAATVCAQVKTDVLVLGRLEFAVLDADGNAVIRNKVSRQDLAKRVGALREMVSRVMKDLRGRGFIVTNPDGSVIVKDRLTSLE